MHRKYFASTVLGNHPKTLPEIITNDVYLASYLMCEGCILSQVERNERKRVSFTLRGDNIRTLRENYRISTVRVSMPLFRDTLISLRRLMDETQQRSISHEHDRALQAVPQC